MSRLRKIQDEVKEWTAYNFPKAEAYYPLLGMGEELGELFHAYLKSLQGIRGEPKELEAAMQDAIGDLLIFTLDFCSKMKWDTQDVLKNTWEEVQKRDWIKFPENGRTK